MTTSKSVMCSRPTCARRSSGPFKRRRFMIRILLALMGLAMLSGCVVQDGNKRGEAPIWYPAFVVRDANTTQQWGGQDIYGVQTGRIDRSQQPAIGAPRNAQPVNPPDSTRTGANSMWSDSSGFYVAGRSTSPVTVSGQQAQGSPPPPGSATVYPTRGSAAEAVGSPTLYPPVGSF